MAGRVNLMCFDKTGTLTEDSLDPLGVRASVNGTFQEEEREIVNCETKLLRILASCHSIVKLNEKFIGDPLEIKMFNATDWNYEGDKTYENPGNHQSKSTTIVSEPNGEKIEILKRFEFSSELQRMSALVRLESDVYNVYVKGSPEKIRELCEEGSIPKDFEQVLSFYTAQGFRVIACAERRASLHEIENMHNIQRKQFEEKLVFRGLFILENKLKAVTTETINKLLDAKVRSVMVTGDNVRTALSVARECNILSPATHTAICEYDTKKGALQCVIVPPFLGKVGGEAAINSREEPSELLQVLRSPSLDLAVTGNAFAFLYEQEKQLFQLVVAKANVFARMKPSQKTLLVETLKNEYTVGMCGDGANDAGALKAADVGVSLSEGEASVAAPFTSKIQDISSVHVLLKEGRCSLTTSLQIFKFVTLYSMTEFFTSILLLGIGCRLSDWQFVYIDMFIVLPIEFSMAKTEPIEKLNEKRPPETLMSMPILLSILGQSLIMVAFQFVVFTQLLSKDWYSPIDPYTVIGDRITDSVATSTMFLFSNFQYLVVVFGFSIGKPFRKNMITNRKNYKNSFSSHFRAHFSNLK